MFFLYRSKSGLAPPRPIARMAPAINLKPNAAAVFMPIRLYGRSFFYVTLLMEQIAAEMIIIVN